MALPNQVFEKLKQAQLPQPAVEAIVYMADRLHHLERNFKELSILFDRLVTANMLQDQNISALLAENKKLRSRNENVQSEKIEEEMEVRMSRNMGEVE